MFEHNIINSFYLKSFKFGNYLQYGARKTLTEFEKGKIMAYKEQGLSNSEITRLIQRSRCVVDNYLKSPTNYGRNYVFGRPKSLSPQDKRRVLRLASNESITANKIKAEVGASVCKQTILNYIHISPNLKRRRIETKPPLTNQHKVDRLEFAREHMTWTTEWESIIFSDEKKFNLDGPDGWNYYWHDLRKEPKFYSKRVQGGGSLMIWGAFSSKGKVNLSVVEGRLNSTKYQAMLDTHLLPFAPIIGGQNWTFQQDNATCHRSNSTMDWFRAKKIDGKVLKWPARSSDLNPIENLWGILVRTVYAEGRQFENVRSLKSAVLEAWDDIPQETLRTLATSMRDRMFEVIRKNGGSTKY